MKNVLILHGINYYNAGDHGIVLAMLKALRKKFSDVSITVASPFRRNNQIEEVYVAKVRANDEIAYPDEVSDLYQLPVGKKARLVVIAYGLKAVAFCMSLTVLPFALRKRFARTTDLGSAVLDADVVLSKGGGFLLDRGTTYSVPIHLITIWIAIILRKKTVIYAQSIGPFESGFGRMVAGFVLRRVSLVLARDEYSYEYSTEVLGIDPSKVKLTADAAFALATYQGGATAASAKQAEGCASESPARACITLVSPRFAGLAGEEAESQYCRVIAKVAEQISEQGLDVMFIPHLESGKFSDRILANRIVGFCSPEAATKMRILEPTSPIDIINLMTESAIAICSRMHSMIFSIDARLPFVALSYLPKSDSMLHEADLDDWRVSLPEIATGDVEAAVADVTGKFEAILADLPQSRAKVAAAQELLAKRSDSNLTHLSNLIGS
ncbi:polysaccharide pyruvyl transferase family protein [Qipengyuania sp. SS22]|uniref:polysaccharide pyruvyl transferase family protein n=1 Tax=Qipengyuania sp. SS22 TaxID=2979461 RepID=UPI0021E5B5CB|nr:polysaccharide pyruvyl transferase family protein [Qipengyuania sp. SS22]UYH56084.1 polysaccharide pyruvyl transferase family protein [Qipengyuania sp. SS22]